MTPPEPERLSPAPAADDLPRPACRAIQACLALACAGLVVFAVQAALASGSPDVDGPFRGLLWNGIYFLAAAVCLVRALAVRAERVAWLLVGGSIVVFGMGWVEFTYVTQHLEAPSYPTLADLLWMAFYPPAYIGVALVIGRRLFFPQGRLLFVDGILAALAIAAVAAAVIYEPMLRATGADPVVVATNLVYPLADFHMAVFIVFSAVLTRTRPDRTLVVLALGFAAGTVSDAVWAYGIASDTFVVGTLLDVGWPLMVLGLAYAAYRPPARRAAVDLPGNSRIAAPAAFTLIALGLLIYGNFATLNPVALVLALATLITAGVHVAITLRRAAADRRQAADEVRMARDELARRHAEARHIAETLQRSLLPAVLPRVPGLPIAARYEPDAAGSDVGGDLYDVIPYADGRVLVAIGDVMGKGLEAAKMMGRLRTALQAYALEGVAPERLVERLNRLVLSWEGDPLITLLLVIVDPATGGLGFVRAGHLPPLLRAPDGSARFLEDGGWVPLGLPHARPCPSELVSAEPGTTVVLYTDGLVEQRGVAIDRGLERLRRAVEAGPREPEALADAVFRELRPDGPAGDDVALLALALPERGAQRLHLRLPAQPESLATVRARVGSFLTGVGASPEAAFATILSSSEAAANAIVHAYSGGEGAFLVEARHEDGTIEVEVRDFGFWASRRSDDYGRGLPLMRDLMDLTEVTRSAGGTSVRLRRALCSERRPQRGVEPLQHREEAAGGRRSAALG